ncbi:MAG: ankyrin repeat domain-containing protein [Xanthomonadales bacterium]|nr:ankyrin repeat domain-containing protein [Xanthomonadales bacterium]
MLDELKSALAEGRSRDVQALLAAGLPITTQLERHLPRPYSLAGYALEHGQAALALDLIKQGSALRPLMPDRTYAPLAKAFRDAPTRDSSTLKRLTEGTQSRNAPTLLVNHAILAGDIELCRSILRQRAAIESGPGVDDELLALPPLHLAARQGAADFVEMLCGLGAPTSRRDRQGLTPLHQALRAAGRSLEGAQRIVRILLAHGANPATTSRDGKTPGAEAPEISDGALLKALLDDEQLQRVPGYVKAARRADIAQICLIYDKADGLIFPIAYPDEYWGVGGDHGGTYPTTVERAMEEMDRLEDRRGMDLDWFRPFAEAVAEGRDFDLEELLAHRRKFRIVRHGERV